MRTPPVHLIRAYVNAKPIPPMAKDAYSGSPSLFQALNRIARHATDSTLNVYVSALDNSCIFKLGNVDPLALRSQC